MSESGQLDLVALLSEHAATAESSLNAMEDELNPAIDANPNDKQLLELLDYVTDAQESLKEVRDLLQVIEERDRKEELQR